MEKTVYCPVKGAQINGTDCLIMCDIVDELINPRCVPIGIVWDEKMREICKVCKYHDDIK